MNFVKTESLPDLTCVTCKKVLSQFPIYCHASGPTCGRCPYPQNGIRNEAYEIIAQSLKFPCCYNENGCLQNLLPKNVATHEKLCNFRKHNCPIITTPNCKWKGFVSDLLEHVEKNHCIFLLNEKSFELDFINSHDENYLLPYGESLYIVNRRSDSKKHIFYCTVSYIGSDAAAEDSSYKLVLQSGNKNHMHEICNRMNTRTEIDRDVINEILKDPTSIMARIEVFQKEEVLNDNNDIIETDDNINYDLLRELECLVCMEYMIPPIFQCVTGHSVCKPCKDSLKDKSCPTCEKEFNNTQNFTLAQVINHIVYPCKHRKCKFTAKASHIKQHEADCMFTPCPCPLREYICCTETFQFEELYNHVVDSHYENLLELETVSLPFNFDVDEEIEDCYIIRYGSRLFQLHFRYAQEEFEFAVQLIKPAEEAAQYRFEIDIVDASGSNHRAFCTRNCGPSTGKESAFDGECITFTTEQIRHLITDQLCFRVRVQNNK